MFDQKTITQNLKAIKEAYVKDLQSLRTGRANAGLIEDLRVEYYGVATPLKQLATITVPEPRMILISPWDRKSLTDIEKAILKAQHLGLSPVVDGNSVRLMIPPLTEERRKELVKLANEKCEKYRNEVRRERDKVRGSLKEAEKKKEINEDDKFQGFEKIDELTKTSIEEMDKILEQKKQDIMTV
jgi:ribosome recycling factor